MTLKTRIKELANKKGLSLPNLEAELGFGSGTIVKWDKSAPNVMNLLKVADYLDVTIDYLVKGNEDNQISGNEQEIKINECSKRLLDLGVDPDALESLIDTIEKMQKKD
jgi:transcriptional regulator with XRE-family HTH domain